MYSVLQKWTRFMQLDIPMYALAYKLIPLSAFSSKVSEGRYKILYKERLCWSEQVETSEQVHCIHNTFISPRLSKHTNHTYLQMSLMAYNPSITHYCFLIKFTRNWLWMSKLWNVCNKFTQPCTLYKFGLNWYWIFDEVLDIQFMNSNYWFYICGELKYR